MTQSTLFAVKEGCCPTYNSDEPNYSPFQNLEDSRIRNADHASADTQRVYFAVANIAHAICLWYYQSLNRESHALCSKESAIEMLIRYCHRSREQAIFNIEHSKYTVATNRKPCNYGEEINRVLDDLMRAEEGGDGWRD